MNISNSDQNCKKSVVINNYNAGVAGKTNSIDLNNISRCLYQAQAILCLLTVDGGSDLKGGFQSSQEIVANAIWTAKDLLSDAITSIKNS